MSLPPPSRRERILEQLKTLFEGIVPDEGLDPYFFAWTAVKRAPLNDFWAKGRANVMAVLDQNEQKFDLTNQVEPNIQVFLEWESAVGAGVEGSTWANAVLAEIERIISTNDQLKETGTGEALAVLCKVTGSSLDVDSFATKRVGGTVILSIQYRHANRDPRRFA